MEKIISCIIKKKRKEKEKYAFVKEFKGEILLHRKATVSPKSDYHCHVIQGKLYSRFCEYW